MSEMNTTICRPDTSQRINQLSGHRLFYKPHTLSNKGMNGGLKRE